MTLTTDPLVAEFEPLRSHRQGFWDPLYTDIARLGMPKRDFLDRQSPGQVRTNHIFDSTLMWSIDMLASAMHTFLTPQYQVFFDPFFRPIPGLPKSKLQDEWLHSVRDLILTHLSASRSNFHPTMHEFYLELVSFGTSSFIIFEEDGAPLFRHLPLSETYLVENSLGFIDKLFRHYKMSARKAREEFPEGLPEKVLKAKEAEEFTFLQVIGPAEELGAKVPFDWASVHILLDGGSTHSSTTSSVRLREKGFNEYPVITARWSKIPFETYGRSPAMTVLPEARMLQDLTRTTIRGFQKNIDPPLMVPNDGSLVHTQANPGAIIPIRRDLLGGNQEPRPLFTGARPDLALEFLAQRKDSILRAFFLDRLSIRDRFTGNGPEMTATEVLQLREEAFRFLGPIIARLQLEFLTSMISRVYQILSRSEQIPLPNFDISAPLEVEFRSPAALAQRASDIDALTKWYQTASMHTQMTGDTRVIKTIDPYKLSNYLRERNNVNPDIFREREEVEEEMAQDQQALQQQQGPAQ